jgi:hypothetical protein
VRKKEKERKLSQLWWWVHTYIFWTLEEAGGLWIQGLYGLDIQFEVRLGDIYHILKKTEMKWNMTGKQNKMKKLQKPKLYSKNKFDVTLIRLITKKE